MKSFQIRTTAPETNNSNYCYPGNPCIRISGNCCLPNCVGYVYGAWLEMFGKHKLPATDARTFYGHRVDGYSRSNKPVIGAVACWDGNKYSSHGHIAIVVGIGSDYITVAQSNYGGKYFEVVTCKTNGKGGYTTSGGNSNFQGFIYPPDGYAYVSNENKKDNATIALEVIQGKWGNGNDRKENLTKAGYDYNVIQTLVNSMYQSGNTGAGKTIDEIAREVIQGKWGNGADRKNRLTKAGYNYQLVQERVNEYFK